MHYLEVIIICFPTFQIQNTRFQPHTHKKSQRHLVCVVKTTDSN